MRIQHLNAASILFAVLCSIIPLSVFAQTGSSEPIVTVRLVDDYNYIASKGGYYGSEDIGIEGVISMDGVRSIFTINGTIDRFGAVTTGRGPVLVDQLVQIVGSKNVYFDFVLGNQSGGSMDFKWTSNSEECNVTATKIVLRKCGNRFTTDDVTVTVNGVSQKLPYTPTSADFIDLEFIMPEAVVSNVTSISVSGKGMIFNGLDIYDTPIEIERQEIELILADKYDSGDGFVETYSKYVDFDKDSKVGLMRVMRLDPDSGESVYIDSKDLEYTIISPDGVAEAPEVMDGINGNKLALIKEEGLYTVRIAAAESSPYKGEIEYPLAVAPVANLSFNWGQPMEDGMAVVLPTANDNGRTRTLKDAIVSGLGAEDDADLYYKISGTPISEGDGEETLPYVEAAARAASEAAASEAAENGVIPEGYKWYTARGVDLTRGDTFHYVLAKNGAISKPGEVKYSVYNGPTSVREISEEESDSRLYHIDGTAADASSRGLLIRVMPDGRTAKIIRK